MKILITGATGLVGKELAQALSAKGHELVVVSRSKAKAAIELPFPCEIIECDLGRRPLQQKIRVDAVFHLMGESVAGHRWNDTVKNEILNSRVVSTRNLNQSLDSSVSFYLCASGIGFYGNRPGETLTENLGPDNSFLSKVCQAWEAEADQISLVNPKIQIVKVRIGLVLSQNGGALKKMLLPFKLGVGAALGHGRQHMSWIHIHDLVSLMIYAMENKLSGPLNGCSPEPVTNKEFSRSLAGALNRGLGPSIPEFALKILFGGVSEILMDDQKAIPKAALDKGFEFKFAQLKTAFKDVLALDRDT